MINITRLKTGEQGTFGILTAGEFICKTAELPWKENKRNISCIPAGIYQCKLRLSPRFGLVYIVQNVPDRSFILIHSGNWSGDKSIGYRSHTSGCILLGKFFGTLGDQAAVLVSRHTLNKFIRYMDRQPFELSITEEY